MSSANTIASAPAAARGLSVAESCVSKWEIGPDCITSSALPDATAGVPSMSRISRIRPRSASLCAIAAPMGAGAENRDHCHATGYS